MAPTNVLEALKAQDGFGSNQLVGNIRLGMWGKQKADVTNEWSFELQQDQKLVKITIDHGNLIYSLMFTTQSKGVFHTSKKFGGWNGGETVSEVTFEDDEELIGIDGTSGVSTGEYPGYIIISSLSFITNKKTHGPFGQATGTAFTVPWKNGSFGGFYGYAGYYIDSIGVYMNAIIHVGIWGTKSPGGPQNQWSFQLERNQRLKTITIDHGDVIYSLQFITEMNGVHVATNKFGGWNGGDKVEEVTFDSDEEINAISGTVGTYKGYTVISSLSFITNKKTHGPYGTATETPFSVPWDNGSFVGFYGLAGYYIDGMGVYLMTTK